MKKIFLTLLTASFLFSCGGSSGSSDNITSEEFDYKMLSNEVEAKKFADNILAKVGDNISKLDEINLLITRPSKEGSVRSNKPDYLSITVSFLNPNDPKKLYEYRYWTESGWDNGQSKTVNLVSGNAETFVLADEMYDASGLTSDMIVQAVKEAWDKYKDDTKYSDQWVRSFDIKNGQIEVGIRGILAANDLEKTEYYKKKLK
jgi:hypothetical protein